MAFWNKKKVETLHIDIDLHVIPPQDFYDKLKECFCTNNERPSTMEREEVATLHPRKTRVRRKADVTNGVDVVVFKYTTSKNTGIYFSSVMGRYLLENGWRYITIHETNSGGAIVLNKKPNLNSYELRPDIQVDGIPRKAICYSPRLVKQIEQCFQFPFKNTTTHVHLGKNVSRNEGALRFNMSLNNQ